MSARGRGFVHERSDTGTSEWYTPAPIFRALGLRFDLDPCMPEGGLPWIPAERFFTWRDYGLAQPWNGCVWLNPPYGPHTAKWIGKFLHHGNGLALVFARTSTRWMQHAITIADAVCFVAGRIAFIGPDGKIGKSPGADSLLLACGADSVRALHSSGLGVVVAKAYKP